jgi:hypothetical protein
MQILWPGNAIRQEGSRPVVHWLAALNDTDSGFSGYRDNATKTNRLLDRIYDARLPDPTAARLDEQIAFTDALID